MRRVLFFAVCAVLVAVALGVPAFVDEGESLTDAPVKLGKTTVHADRAVKAHIGANVRAVKTKAASTGDDDDDDDDDAADADADAQNGGDAADVKKGTPLEAGGNAVRVVDEQHPATPLQDEGTDSKEAPSAGDDDDDDKPAGAGKKCQCAVCPCDKLNGRLPGLHAARIVDKLTPAAKQFHPKKRVHRDSLWDQLNGVDGDDPSSVKLRAKLRKVEQEMINSRNWIGEVQHIIKHYEEKIGAVAMGLKSQAIYAQKLKGQIAARHALLERKRMEKKLRHVDLKLRKIAEETAHVHGKAKSLTDLKLTLSKEIQQMEGEIGQLHQAGHISVHG